MKIRPEDLFADLQDWNEGKGATFQEWLGCYGGIEYAVAFSTLFWPEFQVFHDCVFIASFCDEESFQTWLRCSKGDLAGVEAMVNHQHISDLFMNGSPEGTAEQLNYLGEVLKETWQAKLNLEFPDRRMVVDFYPAKADDLVAAQITFYTKRNV